MEYYYMYYIIAIINNKVIINSYLNDFETIFAVLGHEEAKKKVKIVSKLRHTLADRRRHGRNGTRDSHIF